MVRLEKSYRINFLRPRHEDPPEADCTKNLRLADGRLFVFLRLELNKSYG